MNTKKLLLLGLTTIATQVQITVAQELTEYQFECTKTLDIAQQLVQEIEANPLCCKLICMTEDHQIVIGYSNQPITTLIDITDTTKLQDLLHTLHRINNQIDTIFNSSPFNLAWLSNESEDVNNRRLMDLQSKLSHSLHHYQYIVSKNINYINLFIAIAMTHSFYMEVL